MLYIVKAYRLCIVAINCKNTVKMGYRWRRHKYTDFSSTKKKLALEVMSAYMRVDKEMGSQTKYKYTLITKKVAKKHGKR